MKNNKEIIKKVLDYIGKYKIFLLLSIILAAISVALTLYIPILTGNAVDCILGLGQVDFAGILVILKKNDSDHPAYCYCPVADECMQ